MTRRDASERVAGTLAVMRLLAKEAPCSEYDDLMRTAQSSGVPRDELEEMEQARHLARSIQSTLDQRPRYAAAPAPRSAGALPALRSSETSAENGASAPSADRRFALMNQRLVGLVLAGRDLEALLTEAVSHIGGVLEVRDPNGVVLAATGRITDLEDSENNACRAALEAYDAQRPIQLTKSTWIAPIAARAENLGVLVQQRPVSLCPVDVRQLQQAAQICAVLLLTQRGHDQAERQIREELLDELLATPSAPSPRLIERARRLGVELTRPFVIAIARPDTGLVHRASIWSSSYASRFRGLKSVRDGRVALLLQRSDASATARDIEEDLGSVVGQVTVASAGPASDPAEIYRLEQEALRCLEALTALGGAGSAASTEELGFLGMLLSDGRDVEGFIRSTLGPVLDYDAQRVTDLVCTLETYFSSGGSPTRAAAALHVHPNTVIRLLERITELLGPQWQTPAEALEIQLALKLRKMRDTLISRSGERAAAGRKPPVSLALPERERHGDV